MNYTALARKWRPKSFAELAGQEHVRRALVNALESGRVHHAFLFTGTRGVGKTTIARIFAKCLNCETGVTPTPCGVCAACREIDAGRFVDLIEVDAASRTKVDDTRELLDNVQYSPTRGRYKVYLIDEVHMLSTHSFNALLKTLEEPPPHVKFVLATTDPQKLPVTVLSRCLQFNLKRLPLAQITDRMKFILEAENIPFEAAGVRLVAQAADGSMRDGLSLLDQLIAFGGGKADEEGARAMLGTVARDHVVRVAELLAALDASEVMRYARSLEEWAPDYAQVLEELSSLLARVALKQAVSDYEGDELYPPELLERLGKAFAPEDIQLFYQTAITGRRDLYLAPDPRIGFEMTLLRMLAFRPALDEVPMPAPNAAAHAGRSDSGRSGAPGQGTVGGAASGPAGALNPNVGSGSGAFGGRGGSGSNAAGNAGAGTAGGSYGGGASGGPGSGFSSAASGPGSGSSGGAGSGASGAAGGSSMSGAAAARAAARGNSPSGASRQGTAVPPAAAVSQRASSGAGSQAPASQSPASQSAVPSPVSTGSVSPQRTVSNAKASPADASSARGAGSRPAADNAPPWDEEEEAYFASNPAGATTSESRNSRSPVDSGTGTRGNSSSNAYAAGTNARSGDSGGDANFADRAAGVSAEGANNRGARRGDVSPEAAPVVDTVIDDNDAKAAPLSSAMTGGDPWAVIISQLELTGMTRQLASHCVLVGREGPVVRLGMDARRQSLRTSIQVDKLTQALSRHFGEVVRIEFVSADPGKETPAQIEQRLGQESLNSARQAFESDPGVQALRERFGATLLPDSVRPVK